MAARQRNFNFRKLTVNLALLTMLGCGGFYLWKCRDFLVNDHRYPAEIAAAADKYALDSRFVRAVIYEESRFQPVTVGAAGEIGLMQIMPDMAVRDWARANRTPEPGIGVLFSPKLNIEIGCWYLAQGLRRYHDYKNALELALIFYNAGPSRAAAWKPPERDGAVMDRIRIASTRRYVTRIMARYARYCAESAAGIK